MNPLCAFIFQNNLTIKEENHESCIMGRIIPAKAIAKALDIMAEDKSSLWDLKDKLATTLDSIVYDFLETRKQDKSPVVYSLRTLFHPYDKSVDIVITDASSANTEKYPTCFTYIGCLPEMHEDSIPLLSKRIEEDPEVKRILNEYVAHCPSEETANMLEDLYRASLWLNDEDIQKVFPKLYKYLEKFEEPLVEDSTDFIIDFAERLGLKEVK